jgi:hypothetical protein
MDLPVAQKTSVFEPGNQSQHARLLTELQMVLESDQVVGVRPQILLPQLHRRIRDAAGPRVFQSDRLHGAEAQSVATPPRNLFNGQTTFKIIQLLPLTFFDRLRRQQRVVEKFVFFPRHWTINVIG